MLVGVLDCGKSMKEPAVTGNDQAAAKLAVSLGVISAYITHRMMSSKTTEFGIVAYGTEETKNQLNDVQGGYEHIVEVVQMARPSQDIIQSIAEGAVCGESQGDIIDAVIVAQSMLERFNPKHKFNRIMLIITDGESPIDPDGEDDLKQVIAQMKTFGTIIYIVIIGDKSIVSCSRVKSENMHMLQDIAATTGGGFIQVQDIGDSLDFLVTGSGLGTRPMQRKIKFEISPKFQFPCVYWSKVGELKPPTLKKRIISDDDGPKIEREIIHRNPVDPDEVLNLEDRIQGYKYGPQFIPTPSAVVEAMKLPNESTDPLIRLIGFLPSNRVPKHHYLDSPMIIEGSSDSSNAHDIIFSLSTALKSSNHIALVRFLKSGNADPYLAILSPPYDIDIKNGLHPASLLLHRLPCIEDIRDYNFPSLVDGRFGPIPNTSQKYAISSLVDAMTTPATSILSMSEPDKVTVANRCYVAVVASIVSRLSGNSSAISTTVTNNLRFLGDESLASDANAKVKSLFPLVNADADVAGKKRKAFWSDLNMNFQQQQLDSLEHGEAEAKMAEEEDSQPSPSSGITLHLGSVNPEADFRAIVAAGFLEEIIGATETLGHVIELLVTTGGTKAHLRKALACVKAMREAAIANNLPNAFNKFMSDVVQTYRTGFHSQFWRDMRDASVYPISTSEDPNSNIDVDTSKAFYEEAQMAVAPEAIQTSATPEEEDLFGDMQ